MPKTVSERCRARSVSLSLTAVEIFILERLGVKALEESESAGNAVEAYREAIRSAGASADIYPYVLTEEGLKPSLEFAAFLKERGWDGEREGGPIRYGGLYARITARDGG